MSLENNDKKSQTRIAHGLLSRFQLMVKPMIESPLSNEQRDAYFRKKQGEINKGLELIQKQLRIRKVTEKDVVRFRDRYRWGQDQISNIGEFLIEWEYCDTSEFQDEFNLISKTLLALRLLKPDPVYLLTNCSFYKNSNSIDMWYPIIPPPKTYHFQFSRFTLFVEEKESLINIVEKLKSVDFNKHFSFRIACDRLNRSYHNHMFEDILIDLMIGFEALFIKSRKGNKGHLIGKKCSQLIENNKNKQKPIYHNLKKAYRIRNDILHGSTFNSTEIFQLIPYIEDYLRKSILRLIP